MSKDKHQPNPAEPAATLGALSANDEGKARDGRSPLPLVAIALSAIALVATLFGPFRDYASQQRAVSTAESDIQALSGRIDSVSEGVERLQHEVADVANNIDRGEVTRAERDAAVDKRFETVTSQINKSLDDKLSVTRNSIDQALRSAREETTTQLSDSDSTLSELGTTLKSTTASVAKLDSRVKSIDKLVTTRGSISSPAVEPTAANWLLRDLEVWLNIANDRLMVAKDTGLAHTVLTLALTRLDTINDPSLNGVRTAIKEDLQRVTEADVIDTADTASRLRALARDSRQLPFAAPPQLDSISPQDEPSKETSDSSGHQTRDDASQAQDDSQMQAAKDSAKDMAQDQQPKDQQLKDRGLFGELASAVKELGTEMKVSDIVVVRKKKTVYKALLTPEYQYFLRHNTFLMLQAAELGLLQSDFDTYVEHLTTVKSWVSEYYASDAPEVTEFIAQVDELVSLMSSTDTPTIDASVAAVRQINEERFSQ